MTLIQNISVLIFLFTIALIATERINRVYAALLAAGSMLLIGAVAPVDLLEFIDIEILGVIVGMMLLVSGAEKSGIFNTVAVRILRASKSPENFAVILLTFTAFLSMILNNIGAMLISASITITMTRALKLKPETFLIFEAIVANLGGMMLMMSSIPNIIVAMAGGISFNSFAVNMGPLVVILFVATLLIFLRIRREETEEETRRELIQEEVAETETKAGLKHELRITEFGKWVDLAVRELGAQKAGWRQSVAGAVMAATILGFMVYDRFNLPPSFVALTGGVVMMMLAGEEPTEALAEVDWGTIFFLGALFTLINGMVEIGVIESLSQGMLGFAGRWPNVLPITVMWLSALPSAVIDNIPMTATFAPVIQLWVSQGLTRDLWWGLVAGANLGGSLTPIGSPSNILVLGVSEREGHPIPLARFFKLCFKVTLIHLIISTIYLYVISVIL